VDRENKLILGKKINSNIWKIRYFEYDGFNALIRSLFHPPKMKENKKNFLLKPPILYLSLKVLVGKKNKIR